MKKNVDFKNCSFFEGTDAAFTMIAVQGGTFNMGSNEDDSEKPIHKVKLGAFWMGQHLVTQAVWKKVMKGANPSYFKGDNRPVEQVSWDAIVNDFLPQLNELTENDRPKDTQFCLPTEAQWEYAARDGVQEQKPSFIYSGGDKLDDVGWYGENSHDETKPVGLKLPNLLDFYDISGNVWEWCSDTYKPYKDVVDRDLQGVRRDVEKAVGEGTPRVMRGGSWLNDALDCRVSYRDGEVPAGSSHFIGFRLSLFSIFSV
jgi:formylglycine-generating enzyme